MIWVSLAIVGIQKGNVSGPGRSFVGPAKNLNLDSRWEAFSVLADGPYAFPAIAVVAWA